MFKVLKTHRIKRNRPVCRQLAVEFEREIQIESDLSDRNEEHEQRRWEAVVFEEIAVCFCLASARQDRSGSVEE